MEQKTDNKKLQTIIISKKFSGFNEFKVLVDARQKDKDTRLILQAVFCDAEDPLCRLVACDGKRIHILENIWSHNFVKGVRYNVVENAKEIVFIPIENDDAVFPNYRKITEAEPTTSFKSFELEFKKKPRTEREFLSEIFYKLGSNSAPIIDVEYLKSFKAINGVKVSFVDNNDAPIKIESANTYLKGYIATKEDF